jgi:hypothetical protein
MRAQIFYTTGINALEDPASRQSRLPLTRQVDAAENPLRTEGPMPHACWRVPVRRLRRLRASPRGADGCLGTAVVGTAVVGGPAG